MTGPGGTTYWAEYLHEDGTWYPDRYRGPDEAVAVERCKLLLLHLGVHGARLIEQTVKVKHQRVKDKGG